MILITLYRLYKLALHFGAPVVFYARLAWSKVWPERPQRRRLQMQSGQGLVEYALVLVLVAVVVIAILTILGPQVGFVFFKVQCPLAGGTVVPGQGSTIFFDCLRDPNGGNAPPNLILNFRIDNGQTVDFR